MAHIFQPGIVFQSDTAYTADRSEYRIDPNAPEIEHIPHLIYADAVPCAFVLRDLHDVVIDLGGARILFNGSCLPFVLENCRNITLRNFCIDYRRAPYTQFDILEADTQHLALRLYDGFPCIRRDNELIPVDGDTEMDTHNGNMLLQPFDPVTRAPAYNAGCILALVGEAGSTAKNPPLAIQRMRSEIRPDGTLVWYGNFPASYRAGQVLCVTHKNRSCPGIYACDCENITVEHVRMKRVAGFGIHSYFCHDFTVRDMILKVDEDSSELISINADGVHMIGLSGKLTVEDCVFENMLDDGGNFHSYFVPVTAADGGHAKCSLDFPSGSPLAWHRIFRKGDTLTIYRGNTIAVKGHVRVRDVEYPDDSTILLYLEGQTDALRAGDHLENHEAMPEIEIRRCKTGRNRPRGFLLSSWRKTVVEQCHFYNCACAIDFTGDTNYWHESGPVGDVVIRGNIFENCGYCSSSASITAHPNFEACEEAPYYHKNITVENNLFISFLESALNLNYCDHVIYRSNRFIPSKAYPAQKSDGLIAAYNCGDIESDA